MPAIRTLTDLRKLRHVVQVAHSGSFTGASTVLAITQSALTKSVAEVEHLLGMKLFQRLPRGVQLTEAGATFVPRAERILADTGDLMTQLGALQNLSTGRLRIGVTPAAYASFLETTVSAFAQVYPGVHIEVTDGAIDETAEAVITGRIDLAIGGVNYLSAWPKLEINTIAHLHHFMIARIGHPLAQSQPVAADQLLRYPLIMPTAGLTTQTQLNRAYVAAGLSPTPPHYLCDHFPLVKRLVAATDAISPVVSLAPASVRFRDEFSVFEGVLELDEQTLGIVYSRDRELSAAAAAFVDMFQGFLQDSDI